MLANHNEDRSWKKYRGSGQNFGNIADCWNLKIKAENMPALGKARILRDDPETEVLITIDQFSND